MAPRVGFEPTTKWLTATYSTAELPGIGLLPESSAAGGGRFSGGVEKISGCPQGVN